MFKSEEKLNDHLPLRVILRQKPEGGWQGLTEHSFHMAWDDHRAVIYWSGKAASIIGTVTLNAIKAAEDSQKEYYPAAKVFDPLSPECPVQFDIASWLQATGKFDCRNAFFENKS